MINAGLLLRLPADHCLAVGGSDHPESASLVPFRLSADCCLDLAAVSVLVPLWSVQNR